MLSWHFCILMAKKLLFQEIQFQNVHHVSLTLSGHHHIFLTSSSPYFCTKETQNPYFYYSCHLVLWQNRSFGLVFVHYICAIWLWFLNNHILFFYLDVNGKSKNFQLLSSFPWKPPWCLSSVEKENLVKQAVGRYYLLTIGADFKKWFTTKLFLTNDLFAVFACVKWYARDDDINSIGNPVQVWQSKYEQGGPSSFIPVQRIHSQFASAKHSKCNGGNKLAVIPIIRQAYL